MVLTRGTPTRHVRVIGLDNWEFFDTPRLSPTRFAFNRAHASNRQTNPIEARALPMADTITKRLWSPLKTGVDACDLK